MSGLQNEEMVEVVLVGRIQHCAMDLDGGCLVGRHIRPEVVEVIGIVVTVATSEVDLQSKTHLMGRGLHPKLSTNGSKWPSLLAVDAAWQRLAHVYVYAMLAK